MCDELEQVHGGVPLSFLKSFLSYLCLCLFLFHRYEPGFNEPLKHELKELNTCFTAD